jgi:hypothetical protein
MKNQIGPIGELIGEPVSGMPGQRRISETIHAD